MLIAAQNCPHSLRGGQEPRSSPSKLADHAAIWALWLITFSGFFASAELVSRSAIVGISIFVLISFFFYKISRNFDAFIFITFSFILMLYPTIYFINGAGAQINYFIGPILGMAAAFSDRKILKNYVYFILTVQVMLQIYEWISGSFIFYAIGKYDGALYDEEAFAGTVGIFRSKGMFDASTILGATLIYISAIFYKNVTIIAIAIFCCFIGYARLGLLVTILLFMINICISVKSVKNIFLIVVLSLFIFLSIGFFIMSFQGQQFNIDFLFDALDVGSSQNVDRANFWNDGLAFFPTIGFSEFFLGANERFLMEVGTSVENAWMNLLYFGGALMALLYFAAIIRFKSVADMTWDQWAVRFAIIGAGMIAATFHSLATCMWFWMAAMILFKQSSTSGVSLTRLRKSSYQET